jgi:hypothetical protein
VVLVLVALLMLVRVFVAVLVLRRMGAVGGVLVMLVGGHGSSRRCCSA